jgi:hypothetical protein
MKIASLSAIVAAGLLTGGLAVTSANAADLGGNCCADLEERIAELEATTARKGNRKVSLTISGWVAQQIVGWDNGTESNVYVGDIGSTLASHVKFTGQATISPGWTAGYVLHIEAAGTNDSLIQNEFVDNGANALTGVTNGLSVLQSYWFIKSDHLGKVGIGKQSTASDNAAILVDGSGSLVPANWVLFDVAGFGVSGGDTLNFRAYDTCREGGAGGDCFGVPYNAVRYDSPTFGGFSFSASWGEDDIWDVAARYAGEFGGFKLAAAAAYSESTDADNVQVVDDSSEYFQAGAYVQHVATGLFLYGAYGHHEISDDTIATGATFNDREQDTWYVKGGIRQRWTPLGHSVLYGEYFNSQVDNNVVGGDVTPNADSELEFWGIGAVQEIDAAAMSLWLSYRHFEGSADAGFDSALGFSSTPDDFDMIKFGALINF